MLERVVNVAVRPECHNVSGFYKLLTLAIRAGIQSNAFSPGTSNTIQCRNILRPFLVGIHQRVHNYTDELLASCVDFVLSLPNPTLIQIDRQIPFLIRALKLGLSHVPTAKSALRTLEQWTPKTSFVVHLQHVLPHLSGYLLQSRSGGEQVVSDAGHGAIRSCACSCPCCRRRQEAWRCGHSALVGRCCS